MERVYWVRQVLVSFFKRYEKIFLFLLKLWLGWFLFRFINGIGLYRPEFAPLFTAPFDFPYMMLFIVMFAVLPPTLAYGLLTMEICVQISQSLIVTVYVFLILFLILVFYARLDPRKSFLMLGLVACYYLKVPYLAPLFAGMYLGLLSVVPLAIGTFAWAFLPFFKNLVLNAQPVANLDMVALPAQFLAVFEQIFKAVTTDLTWVYTAFSYAMVVLAVHAVSRLSVRRSRDLAVAVGGVINIVCLFIGAIVLKMPFDAGQAVLVTLLCVLIMEIIRFFDIALDYRRAENVRFEDEENYYYVKVIPKIIVADKKRREVRIK